MKKIVIVTGAVIVVVIVLFVFFSPHLNLPGVMTKGTVSVVAAENFYGNVAEQIGGSHVSVTSILSDPNVDPHEYESSVGDGIAVTNANIVIENGLDYDTWMDKLISASPNPNRISITAADVAVRLLPENPHVWYGIDNIAAVARTIADALEKVDPADASDFESNLASFNNSLIPLNQEIASIQSEYGGVPVGLTETIYLYQTQQMNLTVLTPFNFEKAIAEGNDPSAQDVSSANSQITSKEIKVLIFNSQTVTPITTNLENLARQNNIPIVPVSETMPANVDYQAWMSGELDVLKQALAESTGK